VVFRAANHPSARTLLWRAPTPSTSTILRTLLRTLSRGGGAFPPDQQDQVQLRDRDIIQESRLQTGLFPQHGHYSSYQFDEGSAVTPDASMSSSMPSLMTPLPDTTGHMPTLAEAIDDLTLSDEIPSPWVEQSRRSLRVSPAHVRRITQASPSLRPAEALLAHLWIPSTETPPEPSTIRSPFTVAKTHNFSATILSPRLKHCGSHPPIHRPTRPTRSPRARS
jgi:hypothetical protein